MLRKLFLAIALICLLSPASSLLLAQPAHADSTWVIDRFHSDMTIQEDGLVNITETIKVDFRSDKHGIYRDLPFRYQGPNGKDVYTKITVLSVEKNDISEPYDQSTNDYNLQLKIGDPRIGDLKGQFTYTINYTVEGILAGHANYDELYWNVTGNDWGVGINQATAVVRLPKAGVIQQSCYQGSTGSTDACTGVVLANKEVRFAATRQLGMQQGITVAVGYDKGMVPILTVTPPTIKDSLTQYWDIIITAIVVSIIGLIGVAGLWYKRGRDWWWQSPGQLHHGPQTARLKPIGASQPIVVEFTPPENLTPGLIGLLKDQKADTLDVTSTIIDLASRGYLTIAELDKTWIFGSKDYQLNRTDKADTDLMTYEKLLLSSLFGGKKHIKLSSLKNTFYDDLAKVKDELYQEGQKRHFFIQSPRTTVMIYVALAFLLIFGGVVGAILVVNLLHNGIVQGLALGVILPGLALLIVANFMPQRTAYGRDRKI